MATHGISVTVEDRPGILFKTAQVLTESSVDIRYVDIFHRPARTEIFFECEVAQPIEPVIERLRAVDGVRNVSSAPSMSQIYGKRIIIMGGGAQVGQVAVGAISEADRHNIRGERISVDTIPLVGEETLADAVRAVARLPRARVLVLAGALMGGAITDAVADLKRQGVIVISLNMAGSVPDAADIVVTDPLQAGVMAVMAIADTAKFDISRQRQRRY
jgi:energy-converting hydrogenase B subunit Q